MLTWVNVKGGAMHMMVTVEAARFDESAAVAAVQETAEQAREDAVSDLRLHQKRLRAEARDRARRLIRTARSGPRSAHSRYDAAARVLRE